ncbi:hypothetical protein M404DRAFT_580944 [Pisolithus tinctorius Marx 270]|uniref:Uncharacterized protein n=1 Tax=Pisolithus tinctorius Marx 270 TaxID=870435 RepID=A0A0C3JWH9_PISTI|nr:hypothetical protein M404DRAFT_580944 [Pisolithus tinctorius Marx 270]
MYALLLSKRKRWMFLLWGVPNLGCGPAPQPSCRRVVSNNFVLSFYVCFNVAIVKKQSLFLFRLRYWWPVDFPTTSSHAEPARTNTSRIHAS